MSQVTRMGRYVRSQFSGSRRGWLFSSALLAALILYVFLLWNRGDLHVLESVRRLGWRGVFTSFAFYSIDLLIAAFAWSVVFTKIGGLSGWRRHFKIYISTNVTKRLPGRWWHVAGRALLYEQEGIGKRVTAVAAGMEIALLILSAIFIGLITWPFLAGKETIQPLWLVISALVGLLLIRPAIVKGLMRRLHVAPPSQPLGNGDLLYWLGLYGLVWLGGGVMLYTVVANMGGLPLHALPGIIGVMALSGIAGMATIVVPGGFGVTEITMSFLLAAYMPPGDAILAAIFMRVLLIVFDLLWALVALRLF